MTAYTPNGAARGVAATVTAADPHDASTPALELRDLFKIYREGAIDTVALRGAWLTVAPGEFVAVVGPSGSGKSTLLAVAAGLTAPSAGKVLLSGRDLAALSEDERAALRHQWLGMVLQHDNLIPFLTARENVELALTGVPSQKRRRRAEELLARVGLGDRCHHVPSQLSGGEQQRAAIAVALANHPLLLLADEPTGELDSVTADAVLRLLETVSRERGMALVLVTHNPEFAARARRSVRMSDGILVPFNARAAQAMAPPAAAGTPSLAATAAPRVLEATALTKTYTGGVAALRGVSLTLGAGECLAVMGPSGSGKSTLLHILGGLDAPTAGGVRIAGRSLSELDQGTLALVRRREIGFVFQSYNLLATLTAAENVALPLLLNGTPELERRSRALDALDAAGLRDLADKLPDQLSGGQRQRVAIARAIVHRPRLLLADEPTGNLDSEHASRITAVLVALARETRAGLVLVTHDPLIAAQCDRTLHLLDGHTVASRPTGDVTATPFAATEV